MNKILLIQRGVEPNKGFWGTPGGYVGWDESAEETVIREVKEETILDVKKVKLIKVNSDPTISTLVYLVYRMILVVKVPIRLTSFAQGKLI